MAPLPPSDRNGKTQLPPEQPADFDQWISDLPAADHESNNETLARMVNILDYAEGFTLLFARCNFPALRRELAQQAETDLAARHIRVHHVNLTGPVVNIRHLLRDELLATSGSSQSPLDAASTMKAERTPLPLLHEASAPYTTGPDDKNTKLVIFLTGLELSIPYGDPSAPALAQLNLGRDFFPRELPYPLLIWLPDFALTTLARHAPDFWSWRSGLFEFEGTAQERIAALNRHTRDESVWVDVRNLRVEEKLARRSLLESLLDDYLQQPPSTRRDDELVDLYFSLGQICDLQRDTTHALEYYEQALAIQKKTGNRDFEGIILSNISQIYDMHGDYETALDYLEQALAISKELGNRESEGATLNNISQIYDMHGDYETALDYLEQALAITRDIGSSVGEAITLNNLATTAHAHGDHKTALRYLEQALVIQKEVGDHASEGITLNNISQIYDARGDYETALDYLEQALVIQKEIGDRAGEGTTLNNISLIFSARGDYEMALRYLEQALVIRKDIGDVAGLCATLFNIGRIQWQNGEEQKAMSAWVTVYRLASRINLAQGLQALTGLADQLGLEGGLAGWAALAEQMAGEIEPDLGGNVPGTARTISD